MRRSLQDNPSFVGFDQLNSASSGMSANVAEVDEAQDTNHTTRTTLHDIQEDNMNKGVIKFKPPWTTTLVPRINMKIGKRLFLRQRGSQDTAADLKDPVQASCLPQGCWNQNM